LYGDPQWHLSVDVTCARGEACGTCGGAENCSVACVLILMGAASHSFERLAMGRRGSHACLAMAGLTAIPQKGLIELLFVAGTGHALECDSLASARREDWIIGARWLLRDAGSALGSWMIGTLAYGSKSKIVGWGNWRAAGRGERIPSYLLVCVAPAVAQRGLGSRTVLL